MIITDIAGATLEIPDMGVTLRTMLGCAAVGYRSNPKRTWKIKYKGVIVGSVRVKNDGDILTKSLKEPKCQTSNP
jgi:hypothetical protein